MGLPRHPPARKSRVSAKVPTNADISEWFALEMEKAEGVLQKALRRASRAALLWPVEAHEWHEAGKLLTELPGIGPTLAKYLNKWLDAPPARVKPDSLRKGFLSLAQARKVIGPRLVSRLKGDLQMHTEWSDGSGTVEDMAR